MTLLGVSCDVRRAAGQNLSPFRKGVVDFCIVVGRRKTLDLGG